MSLLDPNALPAGVAQLSVLADSPSSLEPSQPVFPGDDAVADAAALRLAFERVGGALAGIRRIEADVEAACEHPFSPLDTVELGPDAFSEGARAEICQLRGDLRQAVSQRRKRVLRAYYHECAQHYVRRYGVALTGFDLAPELQDFDSAEDSFERYARQLADRRDLREHLAFGTSLRAVAFSGAGIETLMEAGDRAERPERPSPSAFVLSAWDVRDRASDKLAQVTPRQAAVIQLTAAVQRLGATRSGKTWTEFSCGFAARHDGVLERSGLLGTIGRAAGQFERVREAIRLARPARPTALPVPEWASRRRYAPGSHDIAGGEVVVRFTAYKNGKCRLHFADAAEAHAFRDYYGLER